MKKTASTVSLVPREILERQALQMRRRARNADISTKRRTRRFIALLGGMAAAWGTGVVVGRRMAQNLPTQYSGVDLELVIGGGAALGGILLQSQGRLGMIGEALEAGGMGVLFYYAGARGEAYGEKSLAAAA